MQTPGPATNRLVPPGQGDGSSYSWEQVLAVLASKELSCCQEFKVASRSLLTVNVLQPVITAFFNSPPWKKLAVPKAGAIKLLVTASSNTSSFPAESFWRSPSSSLQRTMTNSLTIPEGGGGFGWQEMSDPCSHRPSLFFCRQVNHNKQPPHKELKWRVLLTLKRYKSFQLK